MTDRKPRYPGRKLATIPAEEIAKMNAGQEFNITLKRDDDPIVTGTPYNKASVLPNSLAAALCSDVLDPAPADAFRGLYKKGMYTYAAELPVKSWVDDAQKEGYTQTAALTQIDGGPAITDTTQLSEPMVIPTGDEDVDDEILYALSLIYISTPGDKNVTARARDLPDVDLTVYYYAKFETYDASEEGEYQHTAAVAAGEAQDAARAAEKSARAAENSAHSASEDADRAKSYADNLDYSYIEQARKDILGAVDDASASRDAAKESENIAGRSATEAVKAAETSVSARDTAQSAASDAAKSLTAANDATVKAQGYADVAKQFADQTAAGTSPVTWGWDANGYWSVFETVDE